MDEQQQQVGPVWRTVREESRFFGVSEATLRRWIREGVLRVFRHRRTVRLDHRQVEEFIRARTHG